jgi:hypothetical protein
MPEHLVDYVLDLFVRLVNVVSVERQWRRDMAIECKRCGGPTMSETVIKLRRRVLGFRETRSQGAYCATCKLSVSIENRSTIRSETTFCARPWNRFSGFLPVWLHGEPVRTGGGPMGAILFSRPMRRAAVR